MEELYAKVKWKAELGRIEEAASDAVDETLAIPTQPRQRVGEPTRLGSVEMEAAIPLFGPNRRIDTVSRNSSQAGGTPRAAGISHCKHDKALHCSRS